MAYSISMTCNFCHWSDSIDGYALLREITDAAEEMVNEHSLKEHGVKHDEAVEAEVESETGA